TVKGEPQKRGEVEKREKSTNKKLPYVDPFTTDPTRCVCDSSSSEEKSIFQAIPLGHTRCQDDKSSPH
ncbi:hypothetical protein ALC62_14888, partial [Cyphomyrmex costatus]